MKNKIMHIIGSAARTLLGLTFIFSGFVKAVDPLGTTYKIEDYLKAFGGWFDTLLPLAETAAVCLIAFEFVLGICLLFNIRTGWTSVFSLLFYLVMTPLTLYVALVNPVSDCGCFGDALVITNWQTFWKNVILLSLAIILIISRKRIPDTFVWPVELGIASLSLIAVVGFMGWTMYHLPVMDFRPYKVGNNIPELMEYPEDAEPDQYEISFVYEKDGEEQEFTLDTYPKNDSSWTFVRQNSKLIKKGYEPPIHDLEFMTSDFEDMTYDILESEEPITLAIMYDLGKTDMEQAMRLNQLNADCVSRGEMMYGVTGSGLDEVAEFMMVTEAEYPILTCDPVTLKTIVRANPGIIVIKNGIIIDKYNLRNKK